MSGLHIQRKFDIHLARWIVALTLLAGLASVAFFGVRWYNTGIEPPFPLPVASADASVDEKAIPPRQIAAHTVPNTHPRFISIPTLGVSKTRVLRTGVDANNMLKSPDNINDTAWYEKSATPGSGVGAVLIDGHNGGITRDGVFAKLESLKVGDEIRIERGDGKEFRYQVYDIRNMPLEWVNKKGMKEMMYSAVPSLEGLSLITCSGKWIPKDQVFDHRILVRATLVE